jgi:hypothetical protein
MIEARATPATGPAAPPAAAKLARKLRPTWLPDTAGLLACCAASLLVLVPLAGGGMVSTHDGMLHIQRLIALEAALRDGALMPRWLPDLAYGYGTPVFLYYAPLAYMPALVIRLVGGSYVGSVAAAGGLALVLSGLTMYLLARSLFGPLGATAAGIVYASLPYQLVDLYVRGALAETWAFVWLPLGAWCLIRARQDGSRWWTAGLAVSLGGLIATHNVTALLFAPALVALGLLLWLRAGETVRGSWRMALLGFLLGLGLSAWFWLPAITEKGLVQLSEIVEPDLLASFFISTFPPFRLDLLYDYREPTSTALGYPIFWPQVGIVQAALSILGAVAAVRTNGLKRRVLLWAVLLVVGGIVLQLGPAARLYDLVPLLAFVQFPWRLLALVGLGSALLVGGLVEHASSRGSVRLVLAGVAIAASLVTGLGHLEPEHTPVDERYLAADTPIRADLADYGLGTTHSGEYLPASSGQRNAARFRKALLDEPAPKPDTPDAAASSLHISRLDWQPGRIRADVQATTPGRLAVHQFAFPGWTARVDGTWTATSTISPFGLLAVDVPPGTHTVEFVWGQTTIRWTGICVTVASLFGLTLLVVGGRPCGRRGALIVLTVGTAAIVAALTLALSGHLDSQHGAPTASQWHPIDDRLVLLGSRTDSARVAQDGVLQTDLTWLATAASPGGYRARLDVRSSDGTVQSVTWTSETDSRHWQSGEIVKTTLALRLPDGFPAGPAVVSLAFEQPTNLTAVDLGDIVVPPRPSGERESAYLAGAATIVPGLTVAPVGATPVRSWLGGLVAASTARPGGALDVDLRWQATATTPDLRHEYVTVVALQAAGVESTSEPARPGEWFNPLPFWQPGDVVAQRIRLFLPASLQPGRYPVSARIYARDLARGGLAAPGAADSRPRGRPLAELSLGDVTVGP